MISQPIRYYCLVENTHPMSFVIVWGAQFRHILHFLMWVYLIHQDIHSSYGNNKIFISLRMLVEHVWNVMAHAQKLDLVFQRNERVHLNWPGGQFSWLLAAEVCASAVVMVVTLDTPCSEVECKTTGYPLHSRVSPSLPLPCVTVCHHISTELYQNLSCNFTKATLSSAGSMDMIQLCINRFNSLNLHPANVENMVSS